MKNTVMIILMCLLGFPVLVFSQVTPAADSQWRNLFDGKTLGGWVQKGGQARYLVEDGCIVGQTVRGTPNSFLCTEKYYDDFVLELDFQVLPGELLARTTML